MRIGGAAARLRKDRGTFDRSPPKLRVNGRHLAPTKQESEFQREFVSHELCSTRKKRACHSAVAPLRFGCDSTDSTNFDDDTTS